MKVLIAGLVFLLIFGIIGAMIGAFRMLVTVVLLVLSIVAAAFFSPQVSGFLNEHFDMEEKITKNVQSIMESQLGDKVETLEEKAQEELLDKLHLPASWQKEIEKYNNSEWLLEHDVNTFKELVVNTVGRNISVNFAFVLTCLVIFIVVNVLLSLLRIIDLILKLPILKGANRFTGFWIGLLLGVFFLNVILAALPMMQQYPWGQRAANALNANWFTSFIYRHNFLVWVLSKL